MNVLSANQQLGMIPRDESGIEIKYDSKKINTYKIVKDGDYVIHLRSFQGGFAFSSLDGICSPAYTILRPNSKFLCYSFLKEYFVSSRFIKSLKLVTFGLRDGKSIDVDLWFQTEFRIPSLNEQEKIIVFINTIQKKINIIKDKLNVLKKYKEGMVKVHSRTCIKKALRDILSEENLKTKVNNQYEILSSTANGLFSQKEYFNHQVASENNIGYKIIKRGQLLFSPQNLWLGNINLNKEFEVGIVSPSYKIYNIDNSVNSTWLISTLKSPKLLYTYKLVSEQGASVVRRNLNLNQFLNITIVVPSNNEQIGNAISIIESKIDMLNSQLNTLEKMKVNLLNSMFI